MATAHADAVGLQAHSIACTNLADRSQSTIADLAGGKMVVLGERPHSLLFVRTAGAQPAHAPRAVAPRCRQTTVLDINGPWPPPPGVPPPRPPVGVGSNTSALSAIIRTRAVRGQRHAAEHSARREARDGDGQPSQPRAVAAWNRASPAPPAR